MSQNGQTDYENAAAFTARFVSAEPDHFGSYALKAKY